MVEIVNRQRTIRITTTPWRTLATEILRNIGKPDASATIAFVSDTRIRELNRKFRGVDKTTDVLSFPNLYEDDSEDHNLGDIAISAERAKSQAKENQLKFEEEVAQLILHGLLHLCGYDHETDNGEMNRLELKLRKRLRI